MVVLGVGEEHVQGYPSRRFSFSKFAILLREIVSAMMTLSLVRDGETGGGDSRGRSSCHTQCRKIAMVYQLVFSEWARQGEAA